MGLVSGDAPELWNEDAPEKVKALHQAFVDAGSDIILTNTFGCNRNRLKLHNAQDRAKPPPAVWPQADDLVSDDDKRVSAALATAVVVKKSEEKNARHRKNQEQVSRVSVQNMFECLCETSLKSDRRDKITSTCPAMQEVRLKGRNYAYIPLAT